MNPPPLESVTVIFMYEQQVFAVQRQPICSLFRDTMLSREVKLILMNHQLYLKLNFFVNTML